MSPTTKPKKSLAEIRQARSLAGQKSGEARRARGVNTKAKIEKLAIDAERETLQQFYMRGMRGIAQAQVALAKGMSFLYVIKTDKKGNRSRPEVITDQSTIESYLADELDNDEHEYYFIATKEPNNEALKDIQNRVFGKPKETVDVNQHHTFSLVELAKKRGMINGNADLVVLGAPQLTAPQ